MADREREASLSTRPDTVVLCYHAVSESWEMGMSIRPASLEQQVSELLRRGYTPATFVDAVLAPPAERTFAVTFDDAFRSVLRLGFPILSRLGVPATVFVSTYSADPPVAPLVGPLLRRFVGGPDEPDLFPMDWDELRHVQDNGWEVGSHTVDHPLLTTVGDDRLAYELEESKRRIEAEMGRPCRSIAYPSSDYDARVVEFTRRAGYELAGTLARRWPAPPPPLEYPRVSVQRGDSMRVFELKISPTLRRIRATRAWNAADASYRGFKRARAMVGARPG